MGIAMVLIVLILTYPNLPSLEVLTDYRPKIPLRVYTADGFLIGEYGEERRAVVGIQDVPPIMKNAILAAEDDRFYQHGGIDYTGILRAAGANLIGLLINFGNIFGYIGNYHGCLGNIFVDFGNP